MNSIETRNTRIDSARGFVVILMLIGHSVPPQTLYQIIYGFHMPFFFIVSGYLFNYKKWTSLGIKELLKNRFQKYIIPYFSLSVINLLLIIPFLFYNSNLTRTQFVQSIIEYIKWILWGYRTSETAPNCTPLWFLPCLFFSTVFLYYLLNQADKGKRVLFSLSTIILLQVLNILNIPVHAIPWYIEVSMLGSCFMQIGYSLRENSILESKQINYPTIIAVTLIGLYAILNNSEINLIQRTVNNFVLMFVGSTAISFVILFLFLKKLPVTRFLAFIGKNSIIVMAFNFCINSYAVFFFVSKNIAFTWYILCIIDIICLSLIILLWTVLKKLFSHSTNTAH